MSGEDRYAGRAPSAAPIRAASCLHRRNTRQMERVKVARAALQDREQQRFGGSELALL
ncbi:MAG: hypothetical protein NTX90_17370 [Alphaproteobacteria bacterium]|nr:hypothetical protein [Alphaproteobacteria bacterium]